MKDYKNVIINVVLIIVIIVIVSNYSHYTRHNCTITCIDEYGTQITDKSGNVWVSYDTEGYQVGDKVNLIMDDKGTEENIYDDEIIKIQKIKEEELD